MRKELRDIAVNSAAARYGAEHYRSILFWGTVRRAWPVFLLVAIVLGLGWLGTHLSSLANATLGFTIAGACVLGLLVAAGVRRARSPYRRRRFRG